MAYTTPATAVAGSALTAAYLNTNVRDNIAWIATDSPTCRAYLTAAGSISSATESASSFDAERFDNASMHSTSVNISRITIPTGGGGKYIFGATVTWGLNAVGYRQVRLRLNATTDLAIDTRMAVDATTAVESAPMTVYSALAAEYAEVILKQNSGGVLAVAGNPGPGPEFFAFWYRT